MVTDDGSDVNAFDFISAEIPIINEDSTEEDRLLHYLVCRFMIHKTTDMYAPLIVMEPRAPFIIGILSFTKMGFLSIKN